jgi:methyl halide transferase
MQLVASGGLPPGRAFVPGCGRGYDVALLATETLHVTGLEYTDKAVAAARSYVGRTAPEKSGLWTIEQGDFFAYLPGAPFDLAYDHTFLCALSPTDRRRWAAQTARLLRSGGMLITLMWPLYPDSVALDLSRGPPFALSKAVYAELLTSVGFVLESLVDIAPADMIPGRTGVEAIATWRRN